VSATAATTLTEVVPIVPARDVQLAVAWYCEKLGFHAVYVESEYGIVQRDALQIHFWGPSGVPPETSDYMYRIGVGGIERLYDECRAAEIVHPNAPLAEKPWGTIEFAVGDRDGNLITFFEPAPSDNPLEREFPNLFQLLGGYLHQDFDLDHANADAALAAAAHEDKARAAGAARELDALLASSRDDDGLTRLVERLADGYSPTLDGWRIRAWLEHVAAILRGGA
jgi:catechol 2,3-dioxygenase-like lactoylglutathione lyase family enzyme